MREVPREKKMDYEEYAGKRKQNCKKDYKESCWDTNWLDR